MASSREVFASPHEVPAGPSQRQYWADNLRVLVITVVVVYHTALVYLGGSPYFYEERTTSTVWSTVSAPAWIISVFALGPLFLVAGWFSARSLARKGPGAFARARLLRLGVPLIVVIFLINPLADYLGHLRKSPHPSLAHWLSFDYAAGLLWFVAALLACSLAYALLRSVRPAPVAHRWSGAQAMVAATVLIAVTAFVVWQRWRLGDTHTFLHLGWDEWPQGAVLFALGVWAGEAGSWEDLTAWAPRLGWIALAATAVFAAVGVYEKMHGHLQATVGSMSWLTLGAAVLYAIISVAFTVWFTALIRARWTSSGPLRARAGRASYAAYVLSDLVITAIAVLFASLALAPELKYLIVAAVAVLACYLIGYAATRVPGISKIL
jgi:fucose 4-O-acetylase-like acetyltransferase